MNERTREELSELLRRFRDEQTAAEIELDIEAGEQLLKEHPAPTPNVELLRRLEREMALAARRRQRRIRIVRSSVAAAAAAVALGVANLFGPGPGRSTGATYAGMIPHAVWESEDLAGEDLDLAYFDAEIRRVESQIRGLEDGEAEIGSRAVEDLERELMQIEAEFWKG